MPGKALPPPPEPTLPGPAPVAPLAVPPPRPAAPRPAPELQVGTPPPGLDGKRWRELRRGRTKPERTLDLHGRRAQDAHAAVRRFLQEAQADGLRCVAIVTGKGSSTEGGVLRRELPFWLNAAEMRPLLLGAAHPHASNPGAVHLLLRRRR
ncbi:Smr/MutS family protein [Belnapia sp. T18]|uniref:Smr/MutS family protein n=1 Tax=Belnapia arida TaxID=2804533 RepID=A0ABS1U014_9PROT|nr:Smr/MutS family protein [Belnapia arida]MBL6077999.1 Smr/MutS family protein [Belnapia arida]